MRPNLGAFSLFDRTGPHKFRGLAFWKAIIPVFFWTCFLNYRPQKGIVRQWKGSRGPHLYGASPDTRTLVNAAVAASVDSNARTCAEYGGDGTVIPCIVSDEVTSADAEARRDSGISVASSSLVTTCCTSELPHVSSQHAAIVEEPQHGGDLSSVSDIIEHHSHTGIYLTRPAVLPWVSLTNTDQGCSWFRLLLLHGHYIKFISTLQHCKKRKKNQGAENVVFKWRLWYECLLSL